MRKLAIFVEGQTEQIFVREFLKSFASQHSIALRAYVRTISKGSIHTFSDGLKFV